MDFEEAVDFAKEVFDSAGTDQDAAISVIFSDGQEIEVCYDDDGILTWVRGTGVEKEIEDVMKEIYDYAEKIGVRVMSVAAI
jgi:hypothetical protein